jgi:hypothetical protein
MFFDEFYYHHKRRLGRWESIGHPIDSFFFLLCFGFCVLFSFSNFNLYIFIALSIISTLIITKDEWIHSQESYPTENWLHSILFIIHPISLAGLFSAWRYNLKDLILIQAFIITLFMLYQIIYWNFLQGNKNETKG